MLLSTQPQSHLRRLLLQQYHRFHRQRRQQLAPEQVRKVRLRPPGDEGEAMERVLQWQRLQWTGLSTSKAKGKTPREQPLTMSPMGKSRTSVSPIASSWEPGFPGRVSAQPRSISESLANK